MERKRLLPIVDGQRTAIYGRSPTLLHRRSNVGSALGSCHYGVAARGGRIGSY